MRKKWTETFCSVRFARGRIRFLVPCCEPSILQARSARELYPIQQASAEPVTWEVEASKVRAAGQLVAARYFLMSTIPRNNETCIAIPFESEKRTPAGAAGVPRNRRGKSPGAFARKVMTNNVPLPFAGG